MAAFPLIKLATILANHASKPLSNKAKEYAKTSPFFRNYICIPPAQLYHAMEVRMKIWSNKVGKPKEIPPLKESQAVELGASLVGDAVIFLVGSSILLLEYLRRSHKKGLAEMEAAAQMQLMINDVKTLYREKAAQKQQILELLRIIEENHSGVEFNPTPIDPEECLPEHLKTPPPSEEETGPLAQVFGWALSIFEYLLSFTG